MPRPDPTQENLWFGSSFLEASPQWANPHSSVCQEDSRVGIFLSVTFLTRHLQMAGGMNRGSHYANSRAQQRQHSQVDTSWYKYKHTAN